MGHFRLLEANEIDVRVAMYKEANGDSAAGCSLLLYKDARVDQNILDEAFGIFGWKRSHQLLGDRLYCTVEIRDPDTGEWIAKQDVGTESNEEKEKGQASDSFKRACFNLGIGRELYTAPFIWLNEGQFKEKKGKNGKPTTFDKFAVSKIGYKDGVICELEIINRSMGNRVVFTMGGDSTKPLPTLPEEKEKKKTNKKAAKPAQAEPAEQNAPEPPQNTGYPERGEMLKLAKAKYPDGSEQQKNLLAMWKIDSLDKATTAQLMVIWGKYGKKNG